MDYKKAGVDIEAGYKSVELMKAHVKRTMRPEVLGGLGGFSDFFSSLFGDFSGQTSRTNYGQKARSYRQDTRQTPAKSLDIAVSTDKEEYKPGEILNLNLSLLFDKSG